MANPTEVASQLQVSRYKRPTLAKLCTSRPSAIAASAIVLGQLGPQHLPEGAVGVCPAVGGQTHLTSYGNLGVLGGWVSGSRGQAHTELTNNWYIASRVKHRLKRLEEPYMYNTHHINIHNRSLGAFWHYRIGVAGRLYNVFL